MTTATYAPSIFSLPREEQRKAYDEALERCGAEQRLMAAEHKARKPDPRSVMDYRAWHTMGLVCVLVVKHQPKPASLECSRDGSHYPHIYLPTSKSIVQPESTDDFALIVLPKWLAQKAELAGITLPLSPARPWTDEQSMTWLRLDRLRSSINSKIYFAKSRRSNFTRDQVA